MMFGPGHSHQVSGNQQVGCKNREELQGSHSVGSAALKIFGLLNSEIFVFLFQVFKPSESMQSPFVHVERSEQRAREGRRE